MRDWAERVGWLTAIFAAVAGFVLVVFGAVSIVVFLLSLVF